MSEQLDNNVLKLGIDGKWAAAVVMFQHNCEANGGFKTSKFDFENVVKNLSARFTYLSSLRSDEDFKNLHSKFQTWCIENRFSP